MSAPRPAAPAGARSGRWWFSLRGIMKAVAAAAILLAPLAVRGNLVLAALALFVLTNLFLRLYLFLWPVLAADLFGYRGPDPDPAFAELVRDGDAWRIQGRYDEALECYEEAAQLAPGHPGLALALGPCYRRIGRLDRAIAVLSRAGRDHPDVPLLHYELARTLSLAGDPRRALDALARAIELDPALRATADADPDLDPIRGEPRFGRR
jgi:tetratricopeptide (TPR) repeat protein